MKSFLSLVNRTAQQAFTAQRRSLEEFLETYFLIGNERDKTSFCLPLSTWSRCLRPQPYRDRLPAETERHMAPQHTCARRGALA